MLENANIVIKGNNSENSVVTNHINLWEEIDAYIAISTNDHKLLDLISKKIYDVLISKIIWVDTYTELSEWLDSLNTHLQSYSDSGYNLVSLSIIIWIQEKNILHFSKMWKASALLIKKNSEVVEITDVKEEPSNFVYISNGNIKSGEILVFSSTRILNHLTNTELLESASLDTLDEQNKNIKEIVSEENIWKDISIISFKYEYEREEKWVDIFWKASDFANLWVEKVWDTLLAKRFIAVLYKLRDLFHIPKNISKNTFLFFWVFTSFILLYFTSSSLFKTTDTIVVDDYKDNLIEARQYVEHGSENISNPDVFIADLKKAEDLIDWIKNKQLFLWDIEKLLTDINALRKEFNQVDTYNFSDDKIILGSTLNLVKIVELESKVYAVWKSKITWPIVSWVEPSSFSFEFSEDDEFVDAIELNGRIILLTEKNRMLAFTTAWNFSYVSVNGQEKWQEAQKIDKYGSNLYTLSGSWETTQIFRHKKFSNNFDTWETYLKQEDSKSIWSALAMAIDGWFYILKKDLKMLKFFSNPYRLESLFLNELPANYNYDEKFPVYLTTRADLTYVYLFMNNKIWIFEPNTQNYVNTKSLKYVWQIEGWNEDISAFYVKADGNIYVSNKNGIYKLEFQISDGKLLVQ